MVSHEEVRRSLNYDPESGILTWKVRRGKARIGQEAGYVIVSQAGKRYRQVRIHGRLILSHRLIFFWMTGRLPADEVDHENGNGQDNRWANLKEVTHAANQKNLKKASNNVSGHTGVYWAKREEKWIAAIAISKRQVTLGYFTSKDEAIAVRKAAEITYGFHPNHGSDRPL